MLGDRIMKVISLINQKGGVGKTTSAVNIADILGSQNHKVLLIDLDPQGNTTSTSGVDKKSIFILLQYSASFTYSSLLKESYFLKSSYWLFVDSFDKSQYDGLFFDAIFSRSISIFS